MAQDFRNTLNRVIGTGDTTILNAGDYDAVIGIRCTNITSASVTVDVYIRRSGPADYYIAKGASIPPGGSLELIQGGAKFVMASGDVLYAISNTSNAVDVITSVVDTISS